ncbi:MAG: tetratricopeptide repeat protein, partial [Planctomycetota bacterium]|nr:tetratricopeptide repeat protein [Planctomycetota bacterium]
TSYNNLGAVCQKKGEYDKALGYHEKSLEIRIKAFGAEHPSVGMTYNNIGVAYSNKGEYDKALGYHEKSLAIRLKTLGAEHPDVGDTYFNIGAIYANLKRGFFGSRKKADKKMAMDYLLKAKAIYLKKLGTQHPNTKAVQGWIDGLK